MQLTGSHVSCYGPRSPQICRLRCSAAEQAQSLDSFASSAGIERSRVELATFQGERGLAAVQDVEAMQPLVAVPLASLLVAHPLQRCPFPKFCDSRIWGDSTWDFKLAVQLIHERRKGASSNLASYIANLPQDFDLPLTWSDEELTQLNYPFLQDMVRRQRDDWHGMHERLQTWQQQHCPDQAVSWDEMLWALSACRSRAFGGPYPGSTWKSRARLAITLAAAALSAVTFLHIPTDQAINGFSAALGFNLLYDVVLSRNVEWHTMCPWIDLMNHRTGVTSDVQYQFFSDRMEAFCDQSFARGEQVLMSYGDQSNDSLLQFYAFVEPDNPLDCYMLPDFLSKAAAAAKAENIPVRTDVQPDTTFDAKLLRDGPAEDTMKVLLGLLDQASPATCKKVACSVCADELAGLRRAHIQNGKRAQQSSREKDRHKVAASFRKEKQAVLQACLKSLRTASNP